MEQPWFVYCLTTIEEPIQTYIGATTDVNRRIHQHNSGRKAGGAKLTSRRPNSWTRVCYVEGFTNKVDALRFEWRWKFLSRKVNGNPLERRQKGLDASLAWALVELPLAVLKVVYE